jgi:hypothetical protein
MYQPTGPMSRPMAKATRQPQECRASSLSAELKIHETPAARNIEMPCVAVWNEA